jgi:hypothetical protein
MDKSDLPGIYPQYRVWLMDQAMSQGKVNCLLILGSGLLVYLIGQGIRGENMVVSSPGDAQLPCNLSGASFPNCSYTPVHFPVTPASIPGSPFSLTLADNLLAPGVLFYVLLELASVLVSRC